jgi:hypothetical protein
MNDFIQALRDARWSLELSLTGLCPSSAAMAGQKCNIQAAISEGEQSSLFKWSRASLDIPAKFLTRVSHWHQVIGSSAFFAGQVKHQVTPEGA